MASYTPPTFEDVISEVDNKMASYTSSTVEDLIVEVDNLILSTYSSNVLINEMQSQSYHCHPNDCPNHVKYIMDLLGITPVRLVKCCELQVTESIY